MDRARPLARQVCRNVFLYCRPRLTHRLPHSCDGTFAQFCDSSREENDITSLLENAGQTSLLNFMQTYWKDEQGNDASFWAHEWNKHGTCMRYSLPASYTFCTHFLR